MDDSWYQRTYLLLWGDTSNKMSGEPTRQVRFGKCDECGKVMYVGDLGIHTEMGDYFCSWDCWYKRRDDIWANEGRKVPIRYKKEILK